MEAVVCPVRREVDVYVAMGRARDIATALGFDDIDRTRIEIAVLELTRNILAHAGSGELIIECVEDNGRQGIAIEARDQGPGIADIALALRDGYSTARTLGAGLPGVRRLMDDFHIESTVGVGTRVRAVKWPGKRISGPRKVRR
ncbi:MAG: anti-sigma regulatory factor [Roseiflexus sp.]|nr:anti-sigma regulatory factor [Roseiflexus sp.]MCS7287823.1 anti-sigma regulatory factor [Roseiflexus sp.]MDW8146590.1 anti-sigma regulatory factor [Roseiflexaceae bacterium]MDW8232866.1 anti-sigma regulatory factor [Roseiflexaceae bacterium]